MNRRGCYSHVRIVIFEILLLHAMLSKQTGSSPTSPIQIPMIPIKHQTIDRMYKHGDIILAGLFTVHLQSNRRTNNLNCDGIFNRRGYQMVEAMVYAINQLNNNKTFLPGIKLGYDIKDTCGAVENAIRASLNYSFVRKYFENTCDNHTTKKEIKPDTTSFSRPQTVAIIGPDTSDIARAVADFAGLFLVPVISPSATSPLLGDRVRFKYFLRTVPSDSYQVEMMIDIIEYFGWNYIILLASDDEYGRSARMEFKRKIKSSHYPICPVIDEIVDQSNRQIVIDRIKKEKKSKVIVFISSLKEAELFAKESLALEGFTWISSDAWSKNTFVTTKREYIFNGMLGISPLKTNVDGFQQHLLEQLQKTSRTGWLKEFYRYETNLTCIHHNLSYCILNDNYEMAPYQITSTVNAVYALGHALHKFLLCNENACNRSVHDADWTTLLPALLNVTFMDNYNNKISFDAQGGGLVKYKLWNFQKKGAKYSYADVGTWIGQSLVENNSHQLQVSKRLYWNDINNQVPQSNCSEACTAGHHKSLKDDNARCCWNCVKCVGNSYTNTTNMVACLICPKDYWANKQNTGCIKIENIYLEFTGYWSISILSFSAFGLILLLSTFIIFMCHWSTPVIRASSRGMFYLIMLGIALLFMLPLTVIGEPSEIRCKIQPYSIGLAMSVNIGTLLIKTNRIARIFSRKLFKKKKLQFISLTWQYVMIMTIIFIEVAICLVWEFVLHPPSVIYSKRVIDAQRIVTCTYGNRLLGLVIWCIYNAGLIIICTHQAFLVRKVPTNYNEAKFIAFSMITICTAVMVYIPVYFGTVGYYRDVVACFLYLFAASVEFICLFLPKLYIVLIRPDKNVPMPHRSQSPSLSSRKTSGFESDGDYIPTEQELDALKIRRRNRKRKYGIVQHWKSIMKIKSNKSANITKTTTTPLEGDYFNNKRPISLEIRYTSTDVSDEYSSASSDVTPTRTRTGSGSLPSILRRSKIFREVRFSIDTV